MTRLLVSTGLIEDFLLRGLRVQIVNAAINEDGYTIEFEIKGEDVPDIERVTAQVTKSVDVKLVPA